MSKTTPCFEPKCNELKQKYDTCFNKWYSEVFLLKNSDSAKSKNSTQNNTSICEIEWTQYHGCLKSALNNTNNASLKTSIEKAQQEIEEHPPFFSTPDK